MVVSGVWVLPADKVADDVGMADKDLVAVLLLSGRSSMEVPTESCLNSGPFLEKLLTHTHTARPHTHTHTNRHNSFTLQR